MQLSGYARFVGLDAVAAEPIGIGPALVRGALERMGPWLRRVLDSGEAAA